MVQIVGQERRAVAKVIRVAAYLRVSRDGQTIENQRIELQALADRRGWRITEFYEDEGISGVKSRDKRPGFDRMMKDATRGKFDLVAVWAVDRLGRSTATVAVAMTELTDMGIGFYAHVEAMDSSTPHGRAMLSMAAVFGQLEREMIVERVNAGLARARAAGVKLGRPMVGPKVEAAIRARLAEGMGVLKVAREVGCGVGTVQRIKKAMQAGEAA